MEQANLMLIIVEQDIFYNTEFKPSNGNVKVIQKLLGINYSWYGFSTTPDNPQEDFFLISYGSTIIIIQNYSKFQPLRHLRL